MIVYIIVMIQPIHVILAPPPHEKKRDCPLRVVIIFIFHFSVLRSIARLILCPSLNLPQKGGLFTSGLMILGNWFEQTLTRRITFITILSLALSKLFNPK